MLRYGRRGASHQSFDHHLLAARSAETLSNNSNSVNSIASIFARSETILRMFSWISSIAVIPWSFDTQLLPTSSRLHTYKWGTPPADVLGSNTFNSTAESWPSADYVTFYKVRWPRRSPAWWKCQTHPYMLAKPLAGDRRSESFPRQLILRVCHELLASFKARDMSMNSHGRHSQMAKTFSGDVQDGVFRKRTYKHSRTKDKAHHRTLIENTSRASRAYLIKP